ncbi:DUF4347 domain-containing protein [Nostoc flagelliforme FACHB-838]|uniref:DUF4347 domain-containing protein n=1 Tax=Nostoc flagelliforme FACHB-838 TaxID=2692904 RepID=A0ABR8DX86_9NOSO|nr:DUF4347 domain-containing protein [Nostoc flagelliforme]MBD2533486.1 DUF4347 domain-containing protein [Nostoc flagelliforme FACHB-838]
MTQEPEKNVSANLLEASANLVFIDTAVINYQSLITGITLGSEIVILDSNKDGLTQITEFLTRRKSNSVQSVHIISHGSESSLQLGSTYLTFTNLNSYANQLQKWKPVLTNDADILLYGCDIASGEGTKFVQVLSKTTEADIAASTDKTGSLALGGNWNLEVKTGKIEASLAFESEVIEAYNSILAASFTGTSYSQNFNLLANSGTSIPWTNDSTISGWYATATSYNAVNGNSNTGALYSFGSTSSTERALGSVASDTTGTIYYGLRLQNNTDSAISQLRVSYTGEQWRNASNTSQQKLNFSYQTGKTLTSLTAGTWTPVTSLNFTGPIATLVALPLDGNLAINKNVKTSISINLATPIAVGEEIILRWEDINDSGNDHGLSIDDIFIQVDKTTYVVTNTNDSGVGSLRQAIINANNDPGVETIVFSRTGVFGDATPDIITLTSGELNIAEEVIIQGTGADKLIISGNNTSRVFTATAPLSIDSLTVTQGNALVGGGGIFSTSSVSVSNSTISLNKAIANGGGILSLSLTVSNSTISLNASLANGGGIFSTDATLTNSTISGNTAIAAGGGISSTNLTVNNSTIANNTADTGGGIFGTNATLNNSIVASNSASLLNLGNDVFGLNLDGNAYNLIGNLTGLNVLLSTLGISTDIVNSNPGLKPLGNYGGSTQTHALESNSLALNGGNPSYSGSLTTDQRGTGFNRIEYGRLDIGAFEYIVPKVNFGAANYNTTEGSTAITVTIPITLDRIPAVDVTIPIVINSSSTATQNLDYTISSTTLTFANGAIGSDLTQLITFTIQPDDLPENAETVIVNFGKLTGAEAGTITQTTLNIAANDPIKYAISTIPSVTEGDSGTKVAAFTITRTGGIGVASTVDYAFSSTAIFDTDYNNVLIRSGEVSPIAEFIDRDLSGTLNFAVGENTKTITVDILGDKKFELNQDITVTLSNPNLTFAPESSVITTSSATVKIINDDKQPSIKISNTSVIEGDISTTNNANFALTLSNPSYQPVIVNYNTSDRTAKISDSDYNSGLGTIVFNPDETFKTISFAVKGDRKFESNETFATTLYGAANGAISDSLGVATIINDDINETPSIRISNVSVNEGNTGMITNANFAVTLSNAIYQQVIVYYSTSDGTAKASDSDYNSGLGTIIFNPGETLKTISFGIRGDKKVEVNETFSVNLYGATNVLIADDRGTATIINDDFYL